MSTCTRLGMGGVGACYSQLLGQVRMRQLDNHRWTQITKKGESKIKITIKKLEIKRGTRRGRETRADDFSDLLELYCSQLAGGAPAGTNPLQQRQNSLRLSGVRTAIAPGQYQRHWPKANHL